MRDDTLPSLKMVGLLHLILKRLNTRGREQDVVFEKHRDFLLFHHAELLKLRKVHAQQSVRIHAMCGEADIMDKRCDDYWCLSMERFATLFRDDLTRFWRRLDALRDQVKRLKSVRTVGDITNLKGVGKVTLNVVKEHLAALAREEESRNV